MTPNESDHSEASPGGLEPGAEPEALEPTRIEEAVQIGPPIPGVRLESTLGTGGQGTVFRGRQEYLNRAVAVKVLHRATNAKMADRFRREATILAGLQHPNIVSCFSAGVSETEECFMIMEYIDGPDLHQYVKAQGPLGLDASLCIVRDLAAALAHGLESSIIHRDIKPQNVLLKPLASSEEAAFEAKLTDLGLARFTIDKGEAFELTEQGAVLGTPLTMAPEQSDDPAGVDHRTDIYGLGCVLHWSLTGRHAFTARTMAALYQLKTAGEGLKQLEADPAIPEHVKPLLLAMLAPDREERLQTYAELIEVLEQVRQGRTPRISGARGQVRASAGAGPWAMAAVATIGAAAGAWWLLTQGGQDEPAPSPSTETVAEGPEPTVDELPTGISEAPRDAGVTPTPATAFPSETEPTPNPPADLGGAGEPDLETGEGSTGTSSTEESGSGGEDGTTPGGDAPRPDPLRPALASGETLPLIDLNSYPDGWEELDEGAFDSIKLDTDREDHDTPRLKAIKKANETSIARPMPGGAWRLTGTLEVATPGKPRDLWSSGLELETADGRRLRIRLLYSKDGLDSDPNARARLAACWLEEGQEGADVCRVLVPTEDFMVAGNSKASVDLTLESREDSLTLSLTGGQSPPQNLLDGSPPTFTRVRLISSAQNSSVWENLVLTGI